MMEEIDTEIEATRVTLKRLVSYAEICAATHELKKLQLDAARSKYTCAQNVLKSKQSELKDKKLVEDEVGAQLNMQQALREQIAVSRITSNTKNTWHTIENEALQQELTQLRSIRENAQNKVDDLRRELNALPTPDVESLISSANSLMNQVYACISESKHVLQTGKKRQTAIGKLSKLHTQCKAIEMEQEFRSTLLKGLRKLDNVSAVQRSEPENFLSRKVATVQELSAQSTALHERTNVLFDQVVAAFEKCSPIGKCNSQE